MGSRPHSPATMIHSIPSLAGPSAWRRRASYPTQLADSNHNCDVDATTPLKTWSIVRCKLFELSCGHWPPWISNFVPHSVGLAMDLCRACINQVSNYCRISAESMSKWCRVGVGTTYVESLPKHVCAAACSRVARACTVSRLHGHPLQTYCVAIPTNFVESSRCCATSQQSVGDHCRWQICSKGSSHAQGLTPMHLCLNWFAPPPFGEVPVSHTRNAHRVGSTLAMCPTKV